MTFRIIDWTLLECKSKKTEGPRDPLKNASGGLVYSNDDWIVVDLKDPTKHAPRSGVFLYSILKNIKFDEVPTEAFVNSSSIKCANEAAHNVSRLVDYGSDDHGTERTFQQTFYIEANKVPLHLLARAKDMEDPVFVRAHIRRVTGWYHHNFTPRHAVRMEICKQT